MNPLGRTIYDHHFYIHESGHVNIIGATGTGKSALMLGMILDDIRAGKGVVVLDPHGGIADAVLGNYPLERLNDLFYINPLEHRVPNINPFHGGEEPQQVASRFTRMMETIWQGDQIMARSKWLIRNLVMALLTTGQAVTVVNLEKLLHNDRYREYVRKQVSDPFLVNFFRKVYDTWPKTFREEAVAPVINKVNALAGNPYVRDVLGAPRPSFDFRELIARRQVLVCKLPKELIGDDAAALIGSIVFYQVFRAALSREASQHLPVFTLYADEVQNFIHGLDFGAALAESRKYGLRVVSGHQSYDQLPEEALGAISTNCTTRIAFRVGGVDAHVVARDFATDLQPTHFQSLQDFECRVRTKHDRQPTESHLVATYPPAEPNPARAEHVKTASLRRWGRPVTKIRERIDRFMRL